MGKGKKKKQPKATIHINGSKTAKTNENPDWYKTKHPTWTFNRLDYDWLPADVDWQNDIVRKLGNYETQTWGEIMIANGGRKHGTNSHFDNISELTAEFKERWKQLHLEEYDQVFSLRLTGERRIFGILEGAVLSIVWYDAEHKAYPTSK